MAAMPDRLPTMLPGKLFQFGHRTATTWSSTLAGKTAFGVSGAYPPGVETPCGCRLVPVRRRAGRWTERCCTSSDGVSA